MQHLIRVHKLVCHHLPSDWSSARGLLHTTRSHRWALSSPWQAPNTTFQPMTHFLWPPSFQVLRLKFWGERRRWFEIEVLRPPRLRSSHPPLVNTLTHLTQQTSTHFRTKLQIRPRMLKLSSADLDKSNYLLLIWIKNQIHHIIQQQQSQSKNNTE